MRGPSRRLALRRAASAIVLCAVACLPWPALADGGSASRVPKKEATTGRYVYTDYDRCIGCHICKDVCPTGYIQMGLGE